MEAIHLSFTWPNLPDCSFKEEFFWGVWHPFANLQVNISPLPSLVDVSIVKGRNWFITSSCSPFETNGHGLAHFADSEHCIDTKRAPAAVVFRGYILESAIHSWSEQKDIVSYWSRDHSCHNGVFASIVIGHDGEEIKLTCDAFGISTLYYREFAGGLLFSTNTRFLTTANDQLDLTSARILMHCGSVYGNGSLTEGVLRVPPGTTLRFRNGTVTERKWFDYANLPTGNKPVTLSGLRDVEASFQNSIERCLKLQASGHVLPLSSGYDSRRILAALHSRSVPFEALTVRVLQKEYRDLDGHWASAMSRDLGFKHEVMNLPSPRHFARLDHMRRLLVDFHSIEHTWFLTLYPHIPHKSCLVFDGLGGDVLGETGFEINEFYQVEESRKLQLIVENVITDKYDTILNQKRWPSVQSIRESLIGFLKDLPDGNNKSDFAFLRMRCRSGPGICFQRLIPAGHVTVYPYFDLNYMAAALEFNPLEKLPPNSLQSRCLSEFWPRYYAFPGSRMIPPDSRPGISRSTELLKLVSIRQLQTETGYLQGCKALRMLTSRAVTIGGLAQFHESFLLGASWWLQPFLMLSARQANSRKCWSQ